ncbi:protein RD3-like isoform X2 [Vanacampus margaritifer]
MPLFRWPKWSHDPSTKTETSSQTRPGDRASHELIRELLWHVLERECTTRMLELGHRLAAHSAVDHPCFQRCPRWKTLIPTSELNQLEVLCASIPPVHAAAVLSRCFVETMPSSEIPTLACCQQQIAASPSKCSLTAGEAHMSPRGGVRQSRLPTKPPCVNVTLSGHVNTRFHEVLAASKVMPWELVAVFKLVLRDIDQRQRGEECSLSGKAKQLPTTGLWTSRNKVEQHVAKESSSDEKLREEIPTVSGYVDKAMRYASWLRVKREWELPYYYPVPMRPIEVPC